MDWSEFFVLLTSKTMQIPPKAALKPLQEKLSPGIFNMVHRLLEFILVREPDHRPRIDFVRRKFELMVQATSRRNLLGSSKNNAKESPFLINQSAPVQDVLIKSVKSIQLGFWRLCPFGYASVVNSWSDLFHAHAPSDPILTTHHPHPRYTSLSFPGSSIPDFWGERPWVKEQRVSMNHLGISHVVILAENETPEPASVAVEAMGMEKAVQILRQREGIQDLTAKQGESTAGDVLPSSASPRVLMLRWNKPRKSAPGEVARKVLSEPSHVDSFVQFCRPEGNKKKIVLFVSNANGVLEVGEWTYLSSALALLYVLRSSTRPIQTYEALIRASETYPNIQISRDILESCPLFI